uniref:Uncharacterized protein n=1 Tax=Oryza brachyantha TaxID=4533 RepID=J3N2Q6_ORYBR
MVRRKRPAAQQTPAFAFAFTGSRGRCSSRDGRSRRSAGAGQGGVTGQALAALLGRGQAGGRS